MKVDPHTLSQVLRCLPQIQDQDPGLLVGLDTADDAAVYQLSDHQALILTVDFFTPMVDEPYLFGQIAAANALSDIYAMGGKPFLALNIACFPDCLPPSLLGEILRGGWDKATEAGCILAGGHTVRDEEPKYGLTVLGMAHPDQILTNAGAKPGDILILTKPLGTGIINTALKTDLLSPSATQAALDCMSALNRVAAEVMVQHGANACTDITGFGLLGHGVEMAAASQVCLKIYSHAVPLLPETMDMARMGLIPAGAYNNKGHLEQQIIFDPKLKPESQLILCDPQTSGGLLMAVPASNAETMLAALDQKGVPAAVIGEVMPQGDALIIVA